jgi:hypothetical protein
MIQARSNCSGGQFVVGIGLHTIFVYATRYGRNQKQILRYAQKAFVGSLTVASTEIAI